MGPKSLRGQYLFIFFLEQKKVIEIEVAFNFRRK